MTEAALPRPNVIIIGGGFGGLYAAKRLSGEAVSVELVDRKNHHTFQPLLYQVALAVLSPGEIASPLRHTLRKAPNVTTVLAEVTGIDTHARRVDLAGDAHLAYDYLIVSAGATQQGVAAADNILRDLRGEARRPFAYRDRGTMATIGYHRAVAEIGGMRLSGLLAWLLWSLVHVWLLIGFRNRVTVMLEWIWAYATRTGNSPLITEYRSPQRKVTE